jgi:RimJ/RimL family protein N-acetyltransferase
MSFNEDEYTMGHFDLNHATRRKLHYTLLSQFSYMDFTIRQARPDDAEQLISFLRRLFDEPGIHIPMHPTEFTVTVEQERQLLADRFESQSWVFFLAEANGQVIGVIDCKRGTRQSLCHSMALGISVSSEWRNQGVGSRLMTEAITWAKNTGTVTRIELFVYADNIAAIHLYEKFGFETEGRRRCAVRHNGQLKDDLIMARLL